MQNKRFTSSDRSPQRERKRQERIWGGREMSTQRQFGVDALSKNCVLLPNVAPKADGTIPTISAGNDSPSASGLGLPDQFFPLVDLTDLVVQRPEIIKNAQPKQAAAQQIDDARDQLAHVEPVYAKGSQERKQYPSYRMVQWASSIAEIGLPIHTGDEEQIDQPPDAQKSGREEPNGSRDWLSVIETVRSSESKQPEYVTDGL
jgi:hypothetical protein